MAKMKYFYELTISSSPHMHSPVTTQTIMRDVLIALLPALAGGCWFFGFRALALAVVSVAGCVFFEWAYRKLMKLDSTVYDLSAAVTGLTCLSAGITDGTAERSHILSWIGLIF